MKCWIKVYVGDKSVLHTSSCSDSPGDAKRGATIPDASFNTNWPTWVGPFETIEDARVAQGYLPGQGEACQRCRPVND